MVSVCQYCYSYCKNIIINNRTVASRNIHNSIPGTIFNNILRHFLQTEQIAENKYFTVVTTLLTLYALFGDDIRLSSTEKKMDDVFNALTITSLAAFSVELIACSIGKENYFMGFFMVLDVLATASLVLDITWVAEDLFSTETPSEDSGGSTSVASASRASRAGTKAGRVVRIIRYSKNSDTGFELKSKNSDTVHGFMEFQ